MRRLVISVIIMLMLAVALTGCYSSRKGHRDLRNLMLQENTKLGRNKAFYSKHNLKTRRDANRKYKKNKKVIRNR